MKEYIRRLFCSILISGIALFCFIEMKAGAEEDGLTKAKEGVVEILSGFTDSAGKFHCIKTSSGFLVCNAEGDTYLLTTNHCTIVSKKAKTAYCKKKNLKIDVNNVQNLIKVVVKDDVASDAEIVAQSVESDYCILRVSNVINEKAALKLGNSSKLKTGMTVYAMGFEDDAASQGAEFTSLDVLVREGNIQNLASNQNGVVYLQHSAKISAGNSGGPLLTAEGYVVGLNNSAKSRSEEGIFFSLPINEIREVLDNYDVRYSSLEEEQAAERLETLYIESKKKYESGEYKKGSLTDLEAALGKAEELKERTDISEDDVKAVYTNLEAASKRLKRKMPMKEKAIIGLGVVIFLLLICFIKVVSAYCRENSRFENKNNVEQKQEEKEESFSKTDIKVQSYIREPIEKISVGATSDIMKNDAEISLNKTMILSANKRTLGRIASNSIEKEFLMRDDDAVFMKLDGSKTLMIDQQVNFIGKNADKANIVIAENPAVSRVHAQITWKEQKYYIRDLESANGTFLNNERIQSKEDIELHTGDRIMFADEEYEFKVFKRPL